MLMFASYIVCVNHAALNVVKMGNGYEVYSYEPVISLMFDKTTGIYFWLLAGPAFHHSSRPLTTAFTLVNCFTPKLDNVTDKLELRALEALYCTCHYMYKYNDVKLHVF